MQNPLATYEAALTALKTADVQDALVHQHQAVLALTRAGSLDFALAEYHRYGLGEIRHHEDIMSLGGRLYKDLYLAHSGDAAKEFARFSAEKYEAAYQDTKGYYSGINAATMSLLGGIPEEIVEMRAAGILDGLPAIIDQSDEEIYFTEATRAESYILQKDMPNARAALRRAVDYDPLNFTAHASTLKQFRMIAKARGEDWPWLSEFDPPRAMHFAGHLYGLEGEVSDVPVLTKAQEQTLASGISDAIQENDIGFGYGALAAGSDILIAECLLEEGGELHVVLPVTEKLFTEISVAPFGKSWMRRFKACLKKANSVTVFDNFESWPDAMLQFRASMTGMGGAVRQADFLATEAVQLLLWDGVKGTQGTACDANIWEGTGRRQLIVPYSVKRNARPHPNPQPRYQYINVLAVSDSENVQIFEDIRDALSAAISARSKSGQIQQGIAMMLADNQDRSEPPKPDLCSALPGAIHLCEPGANYVAVHLYNDFFVDYMGLNEEGHRIFALREKG